MAVKFRGKYKAKIFNRFEFKQQFFRFLLVDRIMIKKDNLVLVTGKRGDGKTTLSLKLILGFKHMDKVELQYNEEMNKKIEKKEQKEYKLGEFKAFDLENDMAFTRKELQDLCRGNKKGFILADEAIVNAARRNSMTTANKILHEVLTINRKNGNTVFFCLPSIEDFDISMLQYVTHWIHIDDRGLGCVMLPEAKSIFGRKTWDIDRMKKVYEKFLEDNPTSIGVPYWLFDNFRGYIRFKPLGHKIEEEYLKIANYKKNKDTEERERLENLKITGKQSIPDEKMPIISEIVDKLMKGELTDTADYYAYCQKLDYNKSKMNAKVAELLAKKGDGRVPMRVIKENREKEKRDIKKKELIAKRIVY